MITNMINNLTFGLLLVVVAIPIYFIEAGLFGVDYFTAILPIVFSIIGIGFVLSISLRQIIKDKTKQQ